jgi:hypothetical protein
MHKLLLALMLIGCGGKKDEGAASDKPAAKPETTAANPAETTDKPVEPDANSPAAKPRTDTSYGSCHIVATGAATVDETLSHTGGSMLNVFQWHTPEMRKQIGYADEGMILNCLGKDMKINIVTKKAFPTKPGTYKFGGVGMPRDLMLMGSIKGVDGKLASIMQATGQLEITAFDEKHIAGKLSATVETLPKATGEIKVAVDFDMQCHGLSGCP